MTFLFWLLVRTVVFGIALTFVTRRNGGVRVTPRAAMPLVALTFALLNSLLYAAIATFVTVASLWTLLLVAPFLANAAVLWITARLLRPLKIDGTWALLGAAFTITLFHLALRLLDMLV